MEREKLIRLVSAAQQGDGEAMNDLFNAFYNDVYYFALKTVKDEDLACDITQETFVEIINTLEDLQEPAAFIKWMKQITYHQCTRYFKKKKDVLADEDEEGNTIFDIVSEDRTEFIPDAALDQQDFRKTILAMLDELSEEQRAATLLYYYDELSVKQIAQIQGVSEGTVKSRLNYARKSIKHSVETYEKKNNIKLHSFAFLPFMFWLLKAGAEESAAGAASAASGVAAGVSAATGTTITAVASGAATAGATGATAAGTGIFAKLAAMPLMTKIITGVTAAAIAAGGAGLAASSRRDRPTEPTSAGVTSGTTNPSGSSASTQTSGTTQSTTSQSTSSTTHVHTYEETVVDPTCTEQGYSIFTCQCGESYQGEFVAASGHQWYDDGGMVSEEPTEDTPGQRLYSCAICNYVYVEEIPPLGHEHNYAAVVTEPTCTQQGYTTYTCACGDSYVTDEVSATGHTPSEWIIDQAVTASQPGRKHRECTACGIILAEEEISPIASVGLAYTVNEDGQTCAITGIGTCTDTELHIPEYVDGYQVTAIEGRAFYGCSKLTGISIPNSVSYIGPEAFHGCSSLTSITIPDGVTKIGEKTFMDCSSLTDVNLPANMTNIHYSAFSGCSSLVNITVSDGITYIESMLFWSCSSLISVTLPDGVTHIDSFAFANCTNLPSITIPKDVTYIGSNAFDQCLGLETIIFQGTMEQWNAIEFGDNWNAGAPTTQVICADGVVSLNGEG